ncbi:MAG: NADH-quinone oxidoreductase subunit J [Desulfuromonas sp.]|nr:MAG: NADH-quinone oxidoreductase subunit J [Desulfuromonas sp.]
MEIMYFYLLAAVAVASGFMVVTCKSPVNNAIALMMTFVCLANFYVMLDAPFMAAIQIMVYAGAILMLIIFTIMLLNLGTAVARKGSHSVVWATVLALLIAMQGYFVINRGEVSGITGEITGEMVKKVGHTELIAKSLFTDFLLPFEIASILLLVAIVGAVIIAKKEV